MSSDMSQPPVNEAYEAQNNPVSKEPAEKRKTQHRDEGRVVDDRYAGDSASKSSAQPTSLGRGIHGAPPGEEAHGETEENMEGNRDVDAEQIAPPGEGKVYDAVARDRKPGTGGEEPDFAANLDKKKAEQKSARERIKAARGEGTDVGGETGQHGGPASAV